MEPTETTRNQPKLAKRPETRHNYQDRVVSAGFAGFAWFRSETGRLGAFLGGFVVVSGGSAGFGWFRVVPGFSINEQRWCLSAIFLPHRSF